MHFTKMEKIHNLYLYTCKSKSFYAPADICIIDHIKETIKLHGYFNTNIT